VERNKMEEENKATTKKIIDTVVIASLTSLIASIVGGVAFYVYSQATTATEDIKEIKIQLKVIREESIEQLAELKAEHVKSDERFNEISKFLENSMGGFTLPERPTHKDITEEKDILEEKFNPTQQQAPRSGI
jgi:glutamate synthase domain-containing protein 3